MSLLPISAPPRQPVTPEALAQAVIHGVLPALRVGEWLPAQPKLPTGYLREASGRGLGRLYPGPADHEENGGPIALSSFAPDA